MMTSSNGNIFALLALCAASDAELWCFLWSAPWINGWVNNREYGDLRRHWAHYDVIVMGTMRMSASRWFLCSWWVHVLTMMTLPCPQSITYPLQLKLADHDAMLPIRTDVKSGRMAVSVPWIECYYFREWIIKETTWSHLCDGWLQFGVWIVRNWK